MPESNSEHRPSSNGQHHQQPETQQRTLGQHLGTRLTQIGVNRFFGVPGDYNLALLDELEKEPGLEARWACSELGAGYSADGYARASASGAGCLVVTFTVGGLSAINAVAGAYAENVPLVCIVGGPNSNDFSTGRIIHHTIGKKGSFMQELEAFKHVTCEQVVIHNLESAHELIDTAFAAALRHSKPVYICVCCNLASLSHPSFARPPLPYSISPVISNTHSLGAAVDATAEFLSSKHKPVLVAGPLLRVAKATDAFMHLVDASGYAFAFMPAAKGLLPEDHPQCMGTYWGQMSSDGCGEVVESADAYLLVGAVLNDYATAGYSLNLVEAKGIVCDPGRVCIAGGAGGKVFGCVQTAEFLDSLAKKVEHNSTSLDIFRRLVVVAPDAPVATKAEGEKEEGEEGGGGGEMEREGDRGQVSGGGGRESAPSSGPLNTTPLLTRELYTHIQRVLESDTILIAETGDAVFNCQKLHLPRGCSYEWSQQYGSIGWSVGAAVGASEAGRELEKPRRVLACIGDGSFQVTAVEISTALRYKMNPIIVLINNGSYTIEVQIHDGPYNNLKVWNYVGLIEAMDNGAGGAFAVKVSTETELVDALEAALCGEHRDKLCLIEAIVHRDDCSKELLEWGSLVSKANSRPPAPQ